MAFIPAAAAMCSAPCASAATGLLGAVGLGAAAPALAVGAAGAALYYGVNGIYSNDDAAKEGADDAAHTASDGGNEEGDGKVERCEDVSLGK